MVKLNIQVNQMKMVILFGLKDQQSVLRDHGNRDSGPVLYGVLVGQIAVALYGGLQHWLRGVVRTVRAAASPGRKGAYRGTGGIEVNRS